MAFVFQRSYTTKAARTSVFRRCAGRVSSCLQTMLVSHLHPGHIVIMDDVNFHKNRQVREAIERAGPRFD
jgi:hypothetical protein